MLMFGRRIPAWATLLPLLLAVGAYSFFWMRARAGFEAEIAGVLGPGARATGGFPYRIEGKLGAVSLARAQGGASVRLDGADAVLERQPFRPALTVLGVKRPRLDAGLPGYARATLTIAAVSGRASIDTAFGRLARLSTEWPDARLTLGLVPVALRAAHLELHLRETPVAPIATPPGPAWPTQAEAVARAAGLSLDGGAPLTMEATLAVTAPAPLQSAKGWAAQGGTLEVRRLTLADARDTVVDLAATIAPRADGTLLVNGSLTTICPVAVLAAFAHAPAPAEYRARIPVRIAFGGAVGSVAPTTTILPRFTVRAQEPPCPRLRG